MALYVARRGEIPRDFYASYFYRVTRLRTSIHAEPDEGLPASCRVLDLCPVKGTRKGLAGSLIVSAKLSAFEILGNTMVGG